MSREIQKVCVIGSGVMGSGIAAQVANAGHDVLLLDIVPKDADDRNQLAKGAIAKMLKTDPASRRMLVSAWNPAALGEMALPPCHKSYQFHVDGGRLNCLLYQRSCDMFLGLPFNLAGQATLTSMIAQQAGLEAGEIVWMGGDVHVYLNHSDAIAEQIGRETRDLPVLHLTKAKDIHSYRIDDFVVTGYDPHPPIKAPVAV